MSKMTKTETRAKQWCDDRRRWLCNHRDVEEYRTGFIVEWVASKTWRRNPHVFCSLGGAEHVRVASASGCGYCKLSACLAQLLQWLGPYEEDRDAIARTGGCGFDSVADAVAKHTCFRLRRVAYGRHAEAFELYAPGHVDPDHNPAQDAVDELNRAIEGQDSP